MKDLLRTAFLSAAALLVQGTVALAGVTGTMSGTVVTVGTNAPVAQAKVTASSASQTSSTTTDNGGHFGFVSLVPDTYTVTVAKEGVIESFVQRGVTVLADQVQSLTLLARPTIKTLATVTTRVTTDLVKPGTTANVYSINAAAQARTSTMGGGGAANQGYSAIAALPGAYVIPNQAGWFQTVNIRGGDYDQVGYEFDGVPINRSFDNYPSSNLSAIGQQELQIYTGAAPASAESSGLAGYLNQVIKSGAYPGYGTVDLGIGSPSLYNKASVEVGGATPNRNFSYYVGIGLINQNPRYYDNSNGVSQNANYGAPYDMKITYANSADSVQGVPVQPNGYYLGGIQLQDTSSYANLEDRENVFNFHFGIPHKNDTGKDDIQLLYNTFQLYTNFFGSPNDWSSGNRSFFKNNPGNDSLFPGGPPLFVSGGQYMGPVGQVFTAADPTQVNKAVPYAFPSEPAGFLNDTLTGNAIPSDHRPSYSNGQAIYKLQYQHNIGTQSYLRVYGYLFYSWWFIHDPVGTQNAFFVVAPDYELWTHTRGGSIQYVNQLSPKNLLNIDATLSTATTVRDNNTQMLNLLTGTRSDFAQLVSAADPTNGICYNVANPNVPASCLKASRNASGMLGGNWLSIGPLTCSHNCLGSIGTYFGIPGGGIPAPAGTGCNGPCAWYLSENGPYATYNTVTPRVWGFSLQDTWKPNDRLNLNIGLRDDIYTFGFTPTGGGSRSFWFNAWNAVSCVNPGFNGGNPIDETSFGFVAGTACSSVTVPGFTGSFVPATLTNTTVSGGQITYNEIEPRLGGTYTFNANDVVRFSAGRYSQPPNAAFEQYNSSDQDLPEHLLGPLFYRYGFKSPDHAVSPSVSYNYDFSWEHQFPNTQTSFKLTPFLRKTNNQQQQLYISPQQAFVSGLNVGNETNIGAEFLLDMGNFNNNGWAGQLSYTYTHSYMKYNNLSNGQSPLLQDNVDIQHYNSFTSACAGATPSTSLTSLCGADGGTNAVAAFSGIANPYFKAPSRSLINTSGTFDPYSIIPVGVQLSSVGYVVPHVAALVVQYKRDKWSFIPSVQFHAGQKYGAPETTYGFDPSTCPKALATPVSGDPRYPFGGTGLAPDASKCTGQLVIPDQYTGNFDGIGAFTQPSELQMHMTIGYEATSRVSYTLNLANIVNTCFGGSSEPWNLNNPHWCLYGGSQGFIPPAGNFYNPGDAIQPYVKYPYSPNAVGDNNAIGVTTPFSASFNIQIKL